MGNNSRVLIGCAPKEKNKGKSNLETEYLFKTLKKFGGSLADSKKLACFIESPDSSLESVLSENNIKIIIIVSVSLK